MKKAKEILKILDDRKINVISIILVSIIVQLLFLAILGDTAKLAIPADYISNYNPGAENILAGNGYTLENGEFISRYPPGFSLLLIIQIQVSTITGLSDITVIRFFSILTSIFSSLILYFIFTMVCKNRIAMLGALAWTTYPFHLWLIKNPNPEIPFILFFLGGLASLIYAIKERKLNYFVLSGILTACALLIRPIGLLLLPLYVGFLLFQGRPNLRITIKYAALFILAAFITILPWEIYAYSKINKVIPISINGPLSIVDGLTYAVAPGVRGDIATIPDDVRELMNGIAAKDNLDSMGIIAGFMLDEFSRNPLPVVKLFLLKTVRAWYATNAMWYENYILTLQIVYLLLLIPGFVIALKSSNDRKYIFLLFFVIVAYFWGMAMMVLTILRYMVPGIALLMIFIALTLDKLLSIIFKTSEDT